MIDEQSHAVFAGMTTEGSLVKWTTLNRRQPAGLPAVPLRDSRLVVVERSYQRRAQQIGHGGLEAVRSVWLSVITPVYKPESGRVELEKEERDHSMFRNPYMPTGWLGMVKRDWLHRWLFKTALQMVQETQNPAEEEPAILPPPLYAPVPRVRAGWVKLRMGARLEDRALALARGFDKYSFDNVCSGFAASYDGTLEIVADDVVKLSGESGEDLYAAETVVGGVRDSALHVFGAALDPFTLHPAVKRGEKIPVTRGVPLWRVVPHRGWTRDELRREAQFPVLLYVAALSSVKEILGLEMIDLRYAYQTEEPWVELAGQKTYAVRPEYQDGSRGRRSKALL